jgi:hypothetical protein
MKEEKERREREKEREGGRERERKREKGGPDWKSTSRRQRRSAGQHQVGVVVS